MEYDKRRAVGPRPQDPSGHRPRLSGNSNQRERHNDNRGRLGHVFPNNRNRDNVIGPLGNNIIIENYYDCRGGNFYDCRDSRGYEASRYSRRDYDEEYQFPGGRGRARSEYCLEYDGCDDDGDDFDDRESMGGYEYDVYERRGTW